MKNTTKSRVAFSFTYGTNTSKIVKMVAKGWDTNRIATKLGVPRQSVAAVRAHLTMYSYFPYAYKDGDKVKGICGY